MSIHSFWCRITVILPALSRLLLSLFHLVIPQDASLRWVVIFSTNASHRVQWAASWTHRVSSVLLTHVDRPAFPMARGFGSSAAPASSSSTASIFTDLSKFSSHDVGRVSCHVHAPVNPNGIKERREGKEWNGGYVECGCWNAMKLCPCILDFDLLQVWLLSVFILLTMPIEIGALVHKWMGVCRMNATCDRGSLLMIT